MPIETKKVGNDLKIKLTQATEEEVQSEIMKGAILKSALEQLRNKPGFDPAALSISFGLRL